MMSAKYTEGYERGLDQGWSHANFVDAYGGENITANRAYPKYSHYGDSGKDYYSGWSTGWSEGIERFENGQDVEGVYFEDE
jgi:hypothetical protein